MIARTTASVITRVPTDTLLGVKLHGLYHAYGCDYDFLPFWADDDGGVGALLSGQATVIPSAHAREEWACFLSMHPHVHTVETDRDTAHRLSQAGWQVDTRPILTFSSLTADGEADTNPPLRDIYPLLCEVFGADTLPPFDAWYTDMSHRIRHGCGRACAVADGAVRSCALVTAECAAAGLISGVATATDARGRGYAKRCVATLVSALARAHKQAYICPKNARADSLYRQWGAAEVGTLYRAVRT